MLSLFLSDSRSSLKNISAAKAEMAALNKRHLSVVDDDNELTSHVTPAALTFPDHLFCDGSQAGLLDTQASGVYLVSTCLRAGVYLPAPVF